MRAAVMRNGALVVDELPEPVPELGQVLVQIKACGICGSDLHFLRHGATMIKLTDQMKGLPDVGVPDKLDVEHDVYMGHEFSAEVLEAGPGTVAPPTGTLVTSIPAMLTMTGLHSLAYSNSFPAGYGERMLLSAPFLLEVPNGLDARRAALTEPMAVGLHAVNKSELAAGAGALVLGCGPIGLAVIAALRTRDVEPIVAADFSPARRDLATRMGAHTVVDPATADPFDDWQAVGQSRPLVVFEAVGIPGMINDIMRAAPLGTRAVIVGVCMEPDTINPFYGIGKELNVQFVLGYDPMEFSDSLRAIADGRIDVTPMITGDVDLDGVPGAFEALAHPDRHCKILVQP